MTDSIANHLHSRLTALSCAIRRRAGTTIALTAGSGEFPCCSYLGSEERRSRMSSGNGGWGYLRKTFGGQDRATLRRWACVWLAMVAVGWFWLIPKYVSAQDK